MGTTDTHTVYIYKAKNGEKKGGGGGGEGGRRKEDGHKS